MSIENTINPTTETPEYKLPALPLWVIYDHPRDMPNYFVARMWLTDRPTETFETGKSLEEVRSKLPLNLSRLERHQNDDPVVVEVWL